MRIIAMAILAALSMAELVRLDRMVGALRDDVEIAKASEDPRSAEFRRAYVTALDRVLAEQAARLDGRVVERAVEDVVAWATETFGVEVAERIKPEAEQYLRSAFMAGQRLRSVPEAVAATWDRPRAEAVAWLVEHDRFWIGKVFPEHLAGRFKETLIAGHEAGLGRDDIARRLRQVVTGTPDDGAGIELYRRVASANVTRARNWGSVYSLEAADIERYVWRAVGDERMCERCGWFDGQRFEVEPAMTLARQTIARSPQDIEALAPWPSEDAGQGDFYIQTTEGREYLREHGTDWLQAHGLGMPPLHANCRCVVVAEV